MNHTHKCIITGDTCDADYIDREFLFTPGLLAEQPIAIKADTFYQGQRAIKSMELLDALIEAIKMPRQNRHNWSRMEYDGTSAKYETCEWIFKIVFGIDVWAEEDNPLGDPDDIEFDPEDSLEKMSEIVQDHLLPYGEFGIHTIESVKFVPVTAENYIYRDGEGRSELDKTQLIATFCEGKPDRFYEENGQVYSLNDTYNWVPVPIQSLEAIKKLTTVLWEKSNA
jgi:hypothetical protein